MEGGGGEGDAQSVKKFFRSEPRQLLNLAVTKRTKTGGFNEVTNSAASGALFFVASQETCEITPLPSSLVENVITRKAWNCKNKSLREWLSNLRRVPKLLSVTTRSNNKLNDKLKEKLFQ